ncbi:MAG: DNA primase DnaG [Halobacteriaceae archaeon]
MDDSIKYLIHARIVADGVVDRTDVVGAVFGQTEGLLGDELDIRGLQESSKLGRVDVEIETENGQSFGTLTIGSALDKVETAILGAALETIDRVGPCTADIEVTKIEDVRAAKRRAVIDRAKELLVGGFDDAALTSSELIEEVRDSTRPGSVTEYEGLPAGRSVTSSDAVILVEGRADVRRLVEAGINNVVAIEGTNVPDAIVELTQDRTTTAFLDGDRGGDLILRELAQVAAVDQVARAPRGRSVEDLSRQEVTTALREKEPLNVALARVEGAEDDGAPARPDGSTDQLPPTDAEPPASADRPSPPEPTDEDAQSAAGAETPATIPGHAATIIGEHTGRARVLDADASVIADGDAEDARTLLESTASPAVLIVDAAADQALADVAADAGVDRIVAAARGDFVKQPAAVRVHTNEEVQQSDLPPDTPS